MSNSGEVTVAGDWGSVFDNANKHVLEALLPRYMVSCRWFGGKARSIEAARIVEAVPLDYGPERAYILLIRVDYAEGEPHIYMLPLAFASGDPAAEIRAKSHQSVLTSLKANGGGQEGVLYDASWDPAFASALLVAIEQNASYPGSHGKIVASRTEALHELRGQTDVPLAPAILRAQQSNTSVRYGDRLILKLYRRLEEGTNPDLEIGRFLTARHFHNAPPMAGSLEYQSEGAEPIALAILQAFVPNQGDAWEYTLAALHGYFERALQEPEDPHRLLPAASHVLDLAGQEPPERLSETIGPYLESARLLGRRTAEMHVTLASDDKHPDFKPEQFDMPYQRFVYDSMRSLAETAFSLLDARLEHLPETERGEAQEVAAHRDEVLSRFESLVEREITACRIRCHGDYHLGQVLYTGSDFMIIDFEGEPVRALAERRNKWSPLRDVAGMLRSFHYAAFAAMFNEQAGGLFHNTDLGEIEAWTDSWHPWVSAAFLGEYLAVAGSESFLPTDRDQLRVLLDAYLLEKAVYELIYELNNRPDWVRIPLQGIEQLVE